MKPSSALRFNHRETSLMPPSKFLTPNELLRIINLFRLKKMWANISVIARRTKGAIFNLSNHLSKWHSPAWLRGSTRHGSARLGAASPRWGPKLLLQIFSFYLQSFLPKYSEILITALRGRNGSGRATAVVRFFPRNAFLDWFSQNLQKSQTQCVTTSGNVSCAK